MGAFFRRRHRQRGLGLVEVLVSIAIMSIVLLGIVSSQVNTMQAVRSITQSQDVQALVNGLNLMLNNNATCTSSMTAALGAASASLADGWSSIPLQSLSSNGTVFADTTHPLGKVNVQAITVKNLNAGQSGFDVKVNKTPSGPVATIVNMKRFLAEIDVDYLRVADSNGTSVGGQSMQARRFFVTMTVEGGTLFDCYGGQSKDFFQEMCVRQLGGQYDDTKSPSCLLTRIGISDSVPNRDALLAGLDGDNLAYQPGTAVKPRVGMATNGLIEIGNGGGISFGDLGGFPQASSAVQQRSYLSRCTDATCALGATVGQSYTALTGASNANFPATGLNSGSANRLLMLSDHVLMPSTGALLGVGTGYDLPKASLHVLNAQGIAGIPAGPNLTALFEASGQAAVWLRGSSENPFAGSYAVLYLGRDSMTTDPNWSIGYRRGTSYDKGLVFEYQNDASVPNGDFLVLDVNNKMLYTPQKFKADGDGLFVQNVAIGGNLGVSGNISAQNVAATGIVSASDRRLKTDIRPMESMLEKVLALDPVRFRWKREGPNGPQHLGFIAQDLEGVFPELVVTDAKGMKSVAYMEFSAVLMKALRELAGRQEERVGLCADETKRLRRQIEDMRGQIEDMRAAIAELRAAQRTPASAH